jgi:hypothetical protein
MSLDLPTFEVPRKAMLRSWNDFPLGRDGECIVLGFCTDKQKKLIFARFYIDMFLKKYKKNKGVYITECQVQPVFVVDLSKSHVSGYPHSHSFWEVAGTLF